MRYLLTVVCLVLSCLPLAAQLAVRNFTTEDGLPSENVYCVYPDRDGFLWIGTDNGIARFDGKHFKTYTSADGLADNEIFGFFQDSKGRIWLRTFSGKIGYILGGRLYNGSNDVRLQQFKFNSNIYSIAEHKDTLLIAASDGALAKYHDGKVMHDHTASWVTMLQTEDGLMHVNYDLLQPMDKPGSLSRYQMPKQHPTRATTTGKDIFVSGDFDLFRIPLVTPYLPVPYLRFESKILFLGSSNAGKLFVGTEKGCYRLDLGTNEIDTLLQGFAVSYVTEDFEGGCWVATLNQGLFYFSNFESHLMGLARPGKPHREYLFGQFPDRSQHFLLGQGADLTVIDGLRTKAIVNKAYDKPIGRIHAYLFDSPDKLYVTGERLGCVIDLQARKYQQNPVYRGSKVMVRLPGDSVLSSSGDAIYLHSMDQFAVKFHEYNTDPSYLKVRVNCTAEQAGRLYLGSNNGVYLWEKDTITRLTPANPLGEDRVTCLAATPEGEIWVGLANHGLVRLDHLLQDYFDAALQIPNVRKIRIGPDGAPWACNHEGAFKFEQNANGKFERQSFTPDFGYPIVNCWDILPMEDYALAATNQGLIRFSSTHNPVAPRLVVESAVYGEAADNTVSTLLTGRAGKRFKVRYSGIGFRTNGRLSYRYRIPELDSNWLATEAREIEFPDMRPGRYHFELKAVDPTGMESNIFVSRLELAPFFYQTTLFIVLCAALFLGLVFLVFMRRLGVVRAANQLEQEKSRKEIERIEQQLYVQELEQKAMRLQMNPHFIFNALNTIQGLYANRDIPRAKDYISKLSQLIRQILEHSGYTSISLAKEISLMREYLDVTLYRFEGLFTYTVTIGEGLELEEIMLPPLVLQPIVENAVIHGIAPKGRPGHISITVGREGDHVLVEIQDDGVGIQYSLAHKRERPGHGSSKGMSLTQERLYQHLQGQAGGFLAQEIRDENHVVIGTKVTIRLQRKVEL